MGLKVALSAVLLAVATGTHMPLFKHFELDPEPLPGTHFYPHTAEAKREAPAPAPEEAPKPGTYKEFIISPIPYNPLPPAPPAPAGAWSYMPMFMPAYHGHPAPAPYHPAPAPYHPAPAPYQPAPAPDHPGPFHPDKMPDFKTYSYKVVAPAPEPAPESDLLDIRQAKALEDDSSDINDLIDASPIKEAPIEEAFIPLEAPVEEAPIEEAPVEEDSSEEVSSEEVSNEEEESLEENITEEPLNDESSTDPIDLSEVDDVPAPLRIFRQISEKYQGYF